MKTLSLILIITLTACAYNHPAYYIPALADKACENHSGVRHLEVDKQVWNAVCNDGTTIIDLNRR